MLAWCCLPTVFSRLFIVQHKGTHVGHETVAGSTRMEKKNNCNHVDHLRARRLHNHSTANIPSACLFVCLPLTTYAIYYDFQEPCRATEHRGLVSRSRPTRDHPQGTQPTSVESSGSLRRGPALKCSAVMQGCVSRA